MARIELAPELADDFERILDHLVRHRCQHAGGIATRGGSGDTSSGVAETMGCEVLLVLRDARVKRHRTAPIVDRLPATLELSLVAAPEIERALKAKYHLDEPLWKQYLRYLAGLTQGDFGPSLKYRSHTVNDIIAQGLPVSLSLGALAFCFAVGLGIPLGFCTAARKGHWPDYAGSLLALLVVCVPALVIGPILVMLFAIRWQWFPVALWESPRHAILPVLTLGQRRPWLLRPRSSR